MHMTITCMSYQKELRYRPFVTFCFIITDFYNGGRKLKPHRYRSYLEHPWTLWTLPMETVALLSLYMRVLGDTSTKHRIYRCVFCIETLFNELVCREQSVYRCNNYVFSILRSLRPGQTVIYSVCCPSHNLNTITVKQNYHIFDIVDCICQKRLPKECVYQDKVSCVCMTPCTCYAYIIICLKVLLNNNICRYRSFYSSKICV